MTLILGQQTVPLLSKIAIPLRVTQDLDGGDVTIWVHAITGARPGPILGVLSVQHGDEWIGAEMIRQLVECLDPSTMSGTVLAVPVCNPIALGTGTRNTQPESDGPDLNRVWPGTHTWLAESMSKVLAQEVIAKCDGVLDFHPAPWGATMSDPKYGTDYPSPEVNVRTREMAIAMGYRGLGKGKVVAHFPGPRSLAGYAGAKLGIPALSLPRGGAGFGEELEQQWIEEDIRGIKNVMRYLGILADPLQKPERMLIYDEVVRVDPTVGGILKPVHEPEQFLREVKRGELLGRIISPYTFEELERLEAPCDGWIVYFGRSYPVRPGNWSFGLAVAEGAEWITP